MTEPKDLDTFRPPEAPLEMPYQVLERPSARSPWRTAARLVARLVPVSERRRAPGE